MSVRIKLFRQKKTCARKIPPDQAAPKEIIALRLLTNPTFTSDNKVPYPIHNAMGGTMYGMVLFNFLVTVKAAPHECENRIGLL